MVILMTKIFITHKILKYDFDRVIKKGCKSMLEFLFRVIFVELCILFVLVIAHFVVDMVFFVIDVVSEIKVNQPKIRKKKMILLILKELLFYEIWE